MLTELTVQHLALVESATLSFTPGLNVITGETGAGKSVLMGALQLILGARADKKVLRSGADRGSVRAVFLLKRPETVNQLLEDAGLDPCEDDMLFIRRVIRAEASGQQFINDVPVTLQMLKQVGDLLVDMHGPYDHQSLILPETQRNLVDAAGVPDGDLQRYTKAWKALGELKRKERELTGDQDSLEEQLDLLRYRVKELEEADLKEDEEEELREEHTLAGNAQNILESVSGALQALEDAEGNATDPLTAARRMIAGIGDLHPEAETWLEEVDQCLTGVRELSVSLRLAGERMEADPARLDWLDQRLGLYSRMKKKYGPTVSDCLQTLEESASRLEELENREQRLAEMEQALADATREVRDTGAALRKKREQAGKVLGKEILEQLRDLGFPHARFDIAVEPDDPGPAGADEVDFKFAPNPGEDIRSLKDIASSGEISRVMLAIKTLMAGHDQIPVMVFDEIDANVGGEMGHAIGSKMRRAGETRQVIAITHLPQVAVHGACHLAVSKEVSDGRTYTRVHHLLNADREKEIARMLGGTAKASLSLDHARELLQQAEAPQEPK
jgi:DNA repair protein RecN (Recombination protein N)